jgi:HEAT repeat protein
VGSPSQQHERALGLAATFGVLSKTPNEAALPLLVSALDSSAQVIQDNALRALLDRRHPTGQREIIRRLHLHGERWRPIIDERRGRLSHGLRDGVLSPDPQMCFNACQAILWFAEYDLISALVTAAEDEAHASAELAAQTLLSLAAGLYTELSAPRNYSDRRDPQLVRSHVTSTLEASVKRFNRHQRTEVIDAYLMLVSRDNVTLKQILQDPHHSTYLAVVNGLLHSQRGGVIRLLLSYLDDPHAPSAAMSVLARRTDRKFVEHLLRKIGYQPSSVASQNLRHVESIAWLKQDRTLLTDLDENAQHSAVQLLMASNVKRAEALEILKYVILSGKPAGRLAAIKAMATFNGAEANHLAMQALGDADPRVQAAALAQLRPRGIPGALTRIVEFIDSPHAAVRDAAKESLSEFSFERFLAAFDMLDEEVRRSTGVLVKKINPGAVAQAAEELYAKSRTRRLRGLAVVGAMGAVNDVLNRTIELLRDEDHIVRTEAARALAQCDNEIARQALHRAAEDRSSGVRDAAFQSLATLDRSSDRLEIDPLRAVSALVQEAGQ